MVFESKVKVIILKFQVVRRAKQKSLMYVGL